MLTLQDLVLYTSFVVLMIIWAEIKRLDDE